MTTDMKNSMKKEIGDRVREVLKKGSGYWLVIFTTILTTVNLKSI